MWASPLAVPLWQSHRAPQLLYVVLSPEHVLLLTPGLKNQEPKFFHYLLLITHPLLNLFLSIFHRELSNFHLFRAL